MGFYDCLEFRIQYSIKIVEVLVSITPHYAINGHMTTDHLQQEGTSSKIPIIAAFFPPTILSRFSTDLDNCTVKAAEKKTCKLIRFELFNLNKAFGSHLVHLWQDLNFHSSTQSHWINTTIDSGLDTLYLITTRKRIYSAELSKMWKLYKYSWTSPFSEQCRT